MRFCQRHFVLYFCTTVTPKKKNKKKKKKKSVNLKLEGRGEREERELGTSNKVTNTDTPR